MRLNIKIILIFLIFTIPSAKLFCQEFYGLQLDSMPSRISEISDGWLYHPGDNPDWASPDFADETWDTVPTELNLKGKEFNYFPGVGWFRLHIKIDSSLFNQTVTISFTQKGASEVFFDGKLINKIGVIGSDTVIERKRNNRDVPILIEFNEMSDHVLAIRYSNKDAFRMMKKFNSSEAGFAMFLGNYNDAINAFSNQFVTSKVFLAIFFIFVVMGSLHFLLYLFFRKNRSNLYYSIFVISFSIMIFWSYAVNSYLYYPDFTSKLMYYISLFFPWLLVPLVKLLYLLFFEKSPKFFKVLIGLATLTTVLYFFNFEYIREVLGGYTIIVFIEVLRVIILVLIRKKNGAWIIGTGVIIFIIFFVIIAFIILYTGGLTINGGSMQGFLFFISIMIAILSIPVSMSVYLARDFAITNKNLNIQLEHVKELSAKTIEQEKEKQKILAGQKEILEIQVKDRTAELESEKEKTEQLLLNTLPLKVVNELKTNGVSEPESFENVTVYFSDIVGFTNISTQLEPAALISELNEMFTAFDDIMERNNCERIKTIGDAYLAVCGMPVKQENHAELMAKAAIEICNYLDQRNQNAKIQWRIRIGLHSGKVVGGIVGVKKYIYDVFGDTINTTSRMESNSEPMRINLSETTYKLISDKFIFTPRAPMEIKGKGMMRMFFLERSE